MQNFKIAKIILVFSILGFFIAGFSLYEHFKPLGDSVCNVS